LRPKRRSPHMFIQNDVNNPHHMPASLPCCMRRSCLLFWAVSAPSENSNDLYATQHISQHIKIPFPACDKYELSILDFKFEGWYVHDRVACSGSFLVISFICLMPSICSIWFTEITMGSAFRSRLYVLSAGEETQVKEYLLHSRIVK